MLRKLGYIRIGIMTYCERKIHRKMGDQSLNKKREICVVVASRANYGRIKSLLKALRENKDLELQLIVAGAGFD